MPDPKEHLADLWLKKQSKLITYLIRCYTMEPVQDCCVMIIFLINVALAVSLIHCYSINPTVFNSDDHFGIFVVGDRFPIQ